MSRKLDHIPEIHSYEEIRAEMNRDLEYRLTTRLDKTSLGRPLYYRINLQVVMTQECPYSCPFCLERQNPMAGNNDFPAQIESLKLVLDEHPNARLTITGGEPGLYPEHVAKLAETFRENGNAVSCSINTTGYNTALNGIAHIKLSDNDYVNSDYRKFPECTLQTVMEVPRLKDIQKYMIEHDAKSYSFRFISDLQKTDYDIGIWNELGNASDVKIGAFRIGDFFVYANFSWNGKPARVSIGDMRQQKLNDYQDGYSNIIIHPDGRIGVNWQ